MTTTTETPNYVISHQGYTYVANLRRKIFATSTTIWVKNVTRVEYEIEPDQVREAALTGTLRTLPGEPMPDMGFTTNSIYSILCENTNA